MSLERSELPIAIRLHKRLDLMEERLLQGFRVSVVEPTDAAITQLELAALKHTERLTSIEQRLTILDRTGARNPAV